MKCVHAPSCPSLTDSSVSSSLPCSLPISPSFPHHTLHPFPSYISIPISPSLSPSISHHPTFSTPLILSLSLPSSLPPSIYHSLPPSFSLSLLTINPLLFLPLSSQLVDFPNLSITNQTQPTAASFNTT